MDKSILERFSRPALRLEKSVAESNGPGEISETEAGAALAVDGGATGRKGAGGGGVKARGAGAGAEAVPKERGGAGGGLKLLGTDGAFGAGPAGGGFVGVDGILPPRMASSSAFSLAMMPAKGARRRISASFTKPTSR